MRPLLVPAIAAILAPGVPAAAAVSACELAPASLRSLAAMSDAASARKAEDHIRFGEMLCTEQKPVEADRRFRLAAKDLGADLDRILQPTAPLADR